MTITPAKPARKRDRRKSAQAGEAPACARRTGYLHASEGGAAAAAPAHAPVASSLATLLTRHILRDGELVLLILKPSLWFIVLNGLRFVAVVLILLIGAKLWVHPPHTFRTVELGVFIIAGRVTWSVLQWMGRLYVLTDLRVVRISGVFAADIFDCPLRKVGHVRLNSTFRERLLGLGSIEILPLDESCPAGDWRTVSRPRQVLETIQSTVQRAKQGGNSCHRP